MDAGAYLFSPEGTQIQQINVFNRGFVAGVLLTQYWANVPNQLAAWYALNAAQCALALAGLIVVWASRGRTPAVGPHAAYHRLRRVVVPALFCAWQLWVGALGVAVPTQWLSNMTMAIIFFHAWAEFPLFAFRWLLLRGAALQRASVDAVWRTLATYYAATLVVFTFGSDPYAQGLLSAPFVLVADLGNLAVAPVLAAFARGDRSCYCACCGCCCADALTVDGSGGDAAPHPLTAAEHAVEIIAAAMSVLHVVMFYGHVPIVAVSVAIAADYLVAFAGLNVLLLVLYVAALALSLAAPPPAPSDLAARLHAVVVTAADAHAAVRNGEAYGDLCGADRQLALDLVCATRADGTFKARGEDVGVKVTPAATVPPFTGTGGDAPAPAVTTWRPVGAAPAANVRGAGGQAPRM